VQFAVVKIPCAFQISAISKHSWRDSIVRRWINFSGGTKIAGVPRSQIMIRSTVTNHFSSISCVDVKIQMRAKIQTMILWGGYVVEYGAFRARKWCGSKLLSTTSKSHENIMSYPTMTCGCLLVVQLHSNLEMDSINEKGSIAKISAQSINRKLGSYG
jgi:hypothetical protein